MTNDLVCKTLSDGTKSIGYIELYHGIKMEITVDTWQNRKLIRKLLEIIEDELRKTKQSEGRS